MDETPTNSYKESHPPLSDNRFSYPVIGKIADPGDSGNIMVEFNGYGPIVARILSHIDRMELLNPKNIGCEVFLMFKNGEPMSPVIIGKMDSPMDNILEMVIAKSEREKNLPKAVNIDDETVILKARKKIVLECGKGSITMNMDGSIILKGTSLTSRSEGINKIKGSSVKIN